MNLPSLYEHYTQNGISHGLSDSQPYFTLNNQNITLLSGAVHYFRIPQEYWRDRLRKLRASGLNTVETYVPWNLHEPEMGSYDFGAGGSDYQHLLDIEKFLKTAQEEDLFAIVRPGPYICAEWEFGGLPSWLLREEMMIRTSDYNFMKHVERYFSVLLKILVLLQFQNGGPIIAFQIENEYANAISYFQSVDTHYLDVLKDIYRQNGIMELLFTSDTPLYGNRGSLNDVLNTANFQSYTKIQLDLLNYYQHGRPTMVMEYWTGWYTFWGHKFKTVPLEVFKHNLETILAYPASVNLYMFIGGSNWAFLNGANVPFLDGSTDNAHYRPIISSYDYDALLTESGDYTAKYDALAKILKKHNTFETKLPERPLETLKMHYNSLKITKMLPINEIIEQVPNKIEDVNLLSMEMLPINQNSGQSFGYIIYRKTGLQIEPNSTLTIKGRIYDTIMVLVNGILVSKPLTSIDDKINKFGYWKIVNNEIKLGPDSFDNATLDLIVENWGRLNFGYLSQFNQKKGLWNTNIFLNDMPLHNWVHIPLEFKTKWTLNLTKWQRYKDDESQFGPALYKGTLFISNKSEDTFIDLRRWSKGIVIVNGFPLSRYYGLGPQQTVYLPAPFLHFGFNDLVIFEHFKPADFIDFALLPIYHTKLCILC